MRIEKVRADLCSVYMSRLRSSCRWARVMREVRRLPDHGVLLRLIVMKDLLLRRALTYLRLRICARVTALAAQHSRLCACANL